MAKIKTKIIEYGITLLIIITLNFILPRLMPGDPFLHSSENGAEVVTVYTEEQLAYFQEYYGLDKPMYKQYLSYLGDLIKGDLGFSYYYKTNVMTLIAKRLPWTMLLVLSATVISVLLGILLGSFSAWKRDRWWEQGFYVGMVVLGEIPAFLVGIFLLILLAAKLDLFPLAGAMTPFAVYSSGFDKAKDVISHAALPVLTLTLTMVGGFYLLVRNSLISVLNKDYIQTARAKGLKARRIRYLHALKNAILPLITRIAMRLGGMVGGAILVENVFSYPGLGILMRQAVFVRDYPLLQGIMLILALMVLCVNILAEWLYQYLDPRLRKTVTRTNVYVDDIGGADKGVQKWAE